MNDVFVLTLNRRTQGLISTIFFLLSIVKATILLVGYFVLGPSDLYKLVKEIGKFIQNIRTLGTDLTKTFETNMNDVVQIEELRKAQRELNDAFSFRRTINVDADSDAFTYQAGSAQQNYNSNNNYNSIGSDYNAVLNADGTATAAATAIAGPTTTKKKIRRRVLKRPEPTTTVPDLEMPTWGSPSTEMNTNDSTMSKEEMDRIEREFEMYTKIDDDNLNGDFLSSKLRYDDDDDISGKEHLLEKNKPTQPQVLQQQTNPIEITAEKNRFQQQLSGNWNQQILNKQDKLEPIAFVMNQIALLEQEKRDAIKRINDEYEQKKQLEQEYYTEKRKLLDAAAIQIQEQAFGLNTTSFSPSSTAGGTSLADVSMQ